VRLRRPFLHWPTLELGNRVALRVFCAGALGIAAHGLVPEDPQNVPACPLGPPTANFVVFFRCSPPTWERLFSHGDEKVVTLPPGESNAGNLRKKIALGGGTAPESLQVIIGLVGFGNGPAPQAWQTESGDGIAISNYHLRGKVLTRVCSLTRGHPVGRVAQAALSGRQAIAVRTWIAGEPCVIAVRSVGAKDQASLLTPSFEEDQDRFLKTIHELGRTSPFVVHGRMATPEVAAYIDGPAANSHR